MAEALKILIIGTGVAGPPLAQLLAQAGHVPTLLERTPTLRSSGQQIDIRGAGLEVIRLLNLEEAVRANTTKEAGVLFVDSQNNIKAKLGVESTGGRGFTSEIEILRGDLVEVLFNGAKEERVESIFGDSAVHIIDEGDKVKVHFEKGTERDFDLVVAADGQGSRTRKMVLGSSEESCFKHLGQWTAFFTIPKTEKENSWARWYNAPGKRNILLRSPPDGTTRAHLSIMNEAMRGCENLSVQEQKKKYREHFHDAGWEADRVLQGMDDAGDFYMQSIAQVKLNRWSKGRVVLLGDAAYCASPSSGMGTTLALVGAYILAGEIAHHSDHQAAFEAYEALMRPIVDKAQDLPFGIPAALNPESRWGIWVLHASLAFFTWSGLAGLMFKYGGPPSGIKLPEYDFVKKRK
jgi:2-polyprenyl-6-methoxyphenol hydroxylase-like FAD-dependent oxidoreductase